MKLKRRIILISAPTSALLGAALSAQTLGDFKAISVKEQLIRKGYKPVTNWGNKLFSFGTDIPDEYGIYTKTSWGRQSDIPAWCKQHENMKNNDPKLMKLVGELCFETMASKLANKDKKILPNQGWEKWKQNWDKFKKEKDTTNDEHWSFSEDLLRQDKAPEEFKERCTINSKKPYTDEDKLLLKEVESYCTKQD